LVERISDPLAHVLLRLLLHLRDALHDLVGELIRGHAVLLADLRKGLARLKLLHERLAVHSEYVGHDASGEHASHHRPHAEAHARALTESLAHPPVHPLMVLPHRILHLRPHLLAGLLQGGAHAIDGDSKIGRERIQELFP